MEEELRRCQIHEWYPNFKPYSIQTLFHTLPDSFVRYILGQPVSAPPGNGNGNGNGNDNDNDDDGGGDDADVAALPFLLPKSISGRDPLPRTSGNRLDPISSLSLFYSESDDEEGADNEDGNQPYFPELESDIERSIATLGGAVFPKLNWSSPKDAAWISTDGTLRCTSFAEIALLLKSSDSIAHDLSHSALSSFVLALRKYYSSLRPEMEFRCFARHQKLVAISQREVTSFYPVLLDRKHEIQPLIVGFFWEVVKPRFESQDYTFDVYVMGDGRVKILDFNPWGAFTLPLLFSWEELASEGFGEEGVDFRIVESKQGVRPGLKTAVPYDYLDTSVGSGWDQFLKRADEELRRQEAESSYANA